MEEFLTKEFSLKLLAKYTNLVKKMGINIKDAVDSALNTFDKLILEYKNL